MVLSWIDKWIKYMSDIDSNSDEDLDFWKDDLRAFLLSLFDKTRTLRRT